MAHDAVAGNGHRDRVGRARPRHRPHRPRRADARGDLRVGRRGSRGNLAQRLPHALLERRATHVQRQVEAQRRRLDEAHHLRDEPLEVALAADQPGLREPVLEVARQGVRVVAEQDRADAALGGGHQDRAEGALADGEPDRRAVAAGAEVGRRHPEHLRGGRVEAPARVVAGAIDRVGHRVAARQLVAHAPGAVRRRERLRGEAGGRLEDAVEVEAAQAGGVRERVEARYLLGRLDEPAGPRHRLRARRTEALTVGTAALARAKARALGVAARRVEAHVLAPGQARRAGRPAVHAGRADGVIEDAVGAPVAAGHGRPPLGVALVHGRTCAMSRRHADHDASFFVASSSPIASAPTLRSLLSNSRPRAARRAATYVAGN